MTSIHYCVIFIQVDVNTSFDTLLIDTSEIT